jgi:hypothetical protein
MGFIAFLKVLLERPIRADPSKNVPPSLLAIEAFPRLVSARSLFGAVLVTPMISNCRLLLATACQ